MWKLRVIKDVDDTHRCQPLDHVGLAPHVDDRRYRLKHARSFQGRVARSPDTPYAVPNQVVVNVEERKPPQVHLTGCFNLEISVTVNCPGNPQILEICQHTSD